ncbi:hypothetical protein [Paracoccus sp. (in: a-proteobacteria)]|uniref:hypothetical protein n=1 Tax=Paracoccus sp. TaxID=267 RepID=UPI002AFE8217|nr:hypothetical protein [Paracoccus sp. (in: a-proteobacteria)]
MSDEMMKAIRAAFDAGCEQGSDEAKAYDWGSHMCQTRNQAFEDFMADWNPDSAPIRALLPQPPEDAR